MKTGVAGFPSQVTRLYSTNPLQAIGYNPGSAEILHVWGISRGSAGCFLVRPALGAGNPTRFRKPGTLAPPAGLWPGRPHEDRTGYRPNLVGRTAWEDHRLAHLHADREPRLEKLARAASGRAR